MKTFQIGKTYYTRSICDHNCIYTATIVKRTAKTVTAVIDGGKEAKNFRLSPDYHGFESFKPHGSYSMAAIISADDDKILKPDWEK